MATGTVKWFNTTKGFGFIAPEGGGKDVFVHISAVERAGLTGLADNQKVTYELEEGRGRPSERDADPACLTPEPPGAGTPAPGFLARTNTTAVPFVTLRGPWARRLPWPIAKRRA